MGIRIGIGILANGDDGFSPTSCQLHVRWYCRNSLRSPDMPAIHHTSASPISVAHRLRTPKTDVLNIDRHSRFTTIPKSAIACLYRIRRLSALCTTSGACCTIRSHEIRWRLIPTSPCSSSASLNPPLPPVDSSVPYAASPPPTASPPSRSSSSTTLR